MVSEDDLTVLGYDPGELLGIELAIGPGELLGTGKGLPFSVPGC